MDIIYASSSRSEEGYISKFVKFDASIKYNGSLADNSYQLIIRDAEWETLDIQEGDYIYIDGEEWGGRVDSVKHSTQSAQMTIEGATWRGMLLRKVTIPPSGSAYVTITNMEANAAVAAVIGTEFGSLIAFDSTDTGINVSGSFRYRTMLEALDTMLNKYGMRLYCRYSSAQKVLVVGAEAVTDFSSLVDLSQDYGIDLVSMSGSMENYNRVLALGAGELLEREVISVYIDNGTITTTRPEDWNVEQERVYIYDYSNVESSDELLEAAKIKAAEFARMQSVDMDTSGLEQELELSDIVIARDRLLGVVATATVIEKILTITSNGVATIKTNVSTPSQEV